MTDLHAIRGLLQDQLVKEKKEKNKDTTKINQLMESVFRVKERMREMSGGLVMVGMTPMKNIVKMGRSVRRNFDMSLSAIPETVDVEDEQLDDVRTPKVVGGGVYSDPESNRFYKEQMLALEKQLNSQLALSGQRAMEWKEDQERRNSELNNKLDRLTNMMAFNFGGVGGASQGTTT